jgi:hypothetical protein
MCCRLQQPAYQQRTSNAGASNAGAAAKFPGLRKESGPESEGVSSVWYIEEGGATDQTARTIFNTQDHMSPLTLAQGKLALSFKKTSAEIEQHGRACRCGGAWAWL